MASFVGLHTSPPTSQNIPPFPCSLSSIPIISLLHRLTKDLPGTSVSNRCVPFSIYSVLNHTYHVPSITNVVLRILTKGLRPSSSLAAERTPLQKPVFELPFKIAASRTKTAISLVFNSITHSDTYSLRIPQGCLDWKGIK